MNKFWVGKDEFGYKTVFYKGRDLGIILSYGAYKEVEVISNSFIGSEAQEFIIGVKNLEGLSCIAQVEDRNDKFKGFP